MAYITDRVLSVVMPEVEVRVLLRRMPELPDVEGFRRVAARAEGCRVRSVEVLDPQVLHGVAVDEFVAGLRGRHVAEPRRHGKWLVMPTVAGPDAAPGGGFPCVLLHFGMTGLLHWSVPSDGRHRHDRVVLGLQGGELRYRDMRKLTGLHLARQQSDQDEVLGDLGPDAMEISAAEFKSQLWRRRRQLKPALMDQTVLAGLGNLCVDEVLWRARLHPRGSTTDLTSGQLGDLRRRMFSVLRQSANVGEVPARDSWLTGHRDAAQDRCPRCGSFLERGRAGGRGTIWCPRCQPPSP